MGTWLSRFRQSLATASTVDVRSALRRACETRARIELEPEVVTGHAHQQLVTTIESVDDGGIIVRQPTTNGAVRPLARFEAYRIAFATTEGRVTGDTRTLGRTKITGTEGEVLYGYRLAQPATLNVRERRRDARVLFGNEDEPEAEIYVLSHNGPIIGRVADLGATGARLVCRNAGDHLGRGDSAYFKLDLPSPIGAVREMVTVLGVDTVEDTASAHVRLQFANRNTAIADALRSAREENRRRRSA